MREPDVILKKDNEDAPYLTRWWIIPRNPYLNIYLHRFDQSDDDRALHDHPWCSVSFLLKGEMIEKNLQGTRCIRRFLPVFRGAKFLHRLIVAKGPVWTIFITGPRYRTWGFLLNDVWLSHTEFESISELKKV